jgi:hypothetical protein
MAKRLDAIEREVAKLRGEEGTSTSMPAPPTGTVIFRTNGDQVKPIAIVGLERPVPSGTAVTLLAGRYTARRESIPSGWVAVHPDGVTFDVVAGKSIDVPIITVQSKPIPPQAPSEPVASRAAWGLTGGTDDNPATVRRVLDDMGGNWFRVWCGTGPFPLRSIRPLVDMRINVIATIQPGEGEKLSALDMRKWAKDNRGRIVDSGINILVAGNEWNFDSYRPDDLSPKNWHAAYVQGFLRPLYEELHDVVQVACVPIAHNASPAVYLPEYDRLVIAGAMSVCDVVDMHPYCVPGNVELMRQVMRDVKAMVKRPLISTEFDLVTTTPASQWHATYETHATNAAKVFDVLCHYRIDANPGVAKHWLLDGAGKKTEFYDAVCAVAKKLK